MKGHTGKAERGNDLLCCQISTAAQFVATGVLEHIKTAFVEISDGYLKVKLDIKDAKRQDMKCLMTTAYSSFQSILLGEEKFAKMEVQNDF